MTDIQWADVSSYQPVVTDAYPYRVLAIRSNDGDYVDPHFAANYQWGLNALNAGRLDVLIVYYVYRQNYDVTVGTHTRLLGTSHPGVVSMVDVESWGGQITGDQSAGINSNVRQLASFHGSQLRAIGYGNHGDLDTLWPSKPAGMRLVVAAYGSNPAYPGKLAHQYADNVVTAPFGACDINSADGFDVPALKAALGLVATGPSPIPAPAPAPAPDSASMPTITDGTTSALVWQVQLFMNRVFPSYSHIDAGPGPTSRCGPQTEAAVTTFQGRVGIPTNPPFAIGPKTWAQLFAYGFRPS